MQEVQVGDTDEDYGSRNMDGDVHVKFRWFRTIDTSASMVSLVSAVDAWNAVVLAWDGRRMLYESVPTLMVCGKHFTHLVVDDKRFPCNAITIVPTTIEVNVYVRNELSLTKNGTMDALTSNDSVARPMHVGVDRLSPRDQETVACGRLQLGTILPCSGSPSSRMSNCVYEELLAAKDREIVDLRGQLDNVKSLLVTLEADGGRCETGPKETSASEDGSISQDCGQDEIDLYVTAVTSVGHDVAASPPLPNDKETPESLEWEIQRLGGRSSTPADVEHLLEEIRSLHRELSMCRHKNVEFSKEILKLRADRRRERARKGLLARMAKSSESVYNSDPESSSTQYKELPVLRTFRSLPAALWRASPEHEWHNSSQNTDSIRTEDLLSYGIPRSVASVGVQTDVTALFAVRRSTGRVNRNFSGRRADMYNSNDCFDKDSKMRSCGDCMNGKYRGDDVTDDDDTEELLQEADHFVTRVLGVGQSRLRLNRSGGNRNTLKAGSSGYISQSFRSASDILDASPVVIQPQKVTGSVPRPFIPRGASELFVGHVVRYLGPNGKVGQGSVAYVGSLTGREGAFVGVEDEVTASSSRNIAYVPFKKIILVWDPLE